MRWDRKLAVFTAAVLLFAFAAAGFLLWSTHRRIQTAANRIEGDAAEGFEHLATRVERTEDIFRLTVNRRGKFESQQRYRDIHPAWLREMVYVPGEYLDGEIDYTHTISFRLKTYDTENVYSHRDTPVAYTRYDDEATFEKNGDIYYVTYAEGEREYHFMVRCAPLTEWLDGMKG